MTMIEDALYDNRVLAQRDKDTIKKKNLQAPHTSSAFSVRRGSATYYFTSPERMRLWLEKHPGAEASSGKILPLSEETDDYPLNPLNTGTP